MLKNTLLLTLSVFLGLSENFSLAAQPQKNTEYVILVHGLKRTKFSMSMLARYLSENGYATLNMGYPSTRKPIRVLAEEYFSKAVDNCRKRGACKIHVVSHSMGGIIVRQYLQTHSLPPGSRIVMLSPPNHGSEVTDYLRNFFLYKWLFGIAGQELGTSSQSVPNSLKPVTADIGIITGSRSFNPFFSRLLPGSDDGKVSVESAKLKEMKDFLVVPAGHTFIMNNTHVMKQVRHFLVHGKFFGK